MEVKFIQMQPKRLFGDADLSSGDELWKPAQQVCLYPEKLRAIETEIHLRLKQKQLLCLVK